MKKKVEFINSLWWLTLLIGFLIYFFFREDNLIYNNLFSSPIKINLDNNSSILIFLVYSFPNGLWSLSFSQLIFHIYKTKNLKIFLLSFSMACIGILIEILQLFSYLNGTFDYLDIFTYIMSILVIILIQK